MGFIAYTLPVVPGQSERAKRFTEELEAHLAEYEELNRRASLKRHMTWLQESPMGDLPITVFQIDEPEKLNRRFTGSEYDRWWLGYLREVHGIDLAGGSPPPLPAMVLDWQAPSLLAG